MPISDKCYNLAAPLFKGWLLVDTARRYAEAEERDKALMATVNAGWTWVEFGDVIPESESKAIVADLKVAKTALEGKNFAAAKQMLDRLSGQIFMASLQKVVECECGR